MSEFVNTVDVLGGDDAMTDALIQRTLTEFLDNRVTKIRTFAFSDCTDLVYVNIPNVEYVRTYGFSTCASLTTFDAINVTGIGAMAFYNCQSLKAVILRGGTVCSLGASSALSNTPIASGTGYIYVPAALLDDSDATKDYRQATNWSTYAAQFRALESFTVDGTVDGELDETKI